MDATNTNRIGQTLLDQKRREQRISKPRQFGELCSNEAGLLHPTDMCCPTCGEPLFKVKAPRSDEWMITPCLECHKCKLDADFVQKVRARNAARSVLYRQATLDSFKVEMEHQSRGLAAAQAFVEIVEPGMPIAVIFTSYVKDGWTGYGTGKTHLASAIAGVLCERGYNVVSWSVPEALSQIRSTYNDAGEDTEWRIVREATHCDLLVLDEMGLESYQNESWHHEKMYRIINARYNRGPLIVTTNLPPTELSKHLGGAAFSRLWEMTGQGQRVIDMCGPDWRFQQ